MIKLCEGEASDLKEGCEIVLSPYILDWKGGGKTYLGISRISIINIREEFTSTSNAGNDQTMDIEAIDHEKVA